MEPAELLRTVRRRHGLTQAQLAARARTSQAAISRIERGLVSPSVATLATLLDLMGEELALEARPIDYGHDVTLNREQLAVDPVARIERRRASPAGCTGIVESPPGAEARSTRFRFSSPSRAHGVDFVVIGGVAAMLTARRTRTFDIDVAYARDRDNLERIAEVLRGLDADLAARRRTCRSSSTP